MRKYVSLAAACAAAFFASGLAIADTHNFTVKGTYPGMADKYDATVSVTEMQGTGASGDVFKVVWDFAGTKVSGIGMVTATDRTSLSVAYPVGAGFGVAVVKIADDGSAKVEWFAAGGTKTGSEVWTAVK